MRCYTWERLWADLVIASKIAAFVTGMALLPLALLGAVNALAVWFDGRLLMSWTSYALLLCVLPLAYFVAGNTSAIAFWLLRPLRANIIGYALTGAVLAAIIYPVVGLSMDALDKVVGDLPMGEGPPPSRSWAYYRSMLTTFGAVGFFGGMWWWYQEKKSPHT